MLENALSDVSLKPISSLHVFDSNSIDTTRRDLSCDAVRVMEYARDCGEQDLSYASFKCWFS